VNIIQVNNPEGGVLISVIRFKFEPDCRCTSEVNIIQVNNHEGGVLISVIRLKFEPDCRCCSEISYQVQICTNEDLGGAATGEGTKHATAKWGASKIRIPMQGAKPRMANEKMPVVGIGWDASLFRASLLEGNFCFRS
jgi:hypothetical protein